MNLSDIAILNINSADYHCAINGVTKNEPKNLLKNFDLTKTNGILQNIKIYYYILKNG